MQGKRNWKEVSDTEEARELRLVAETQYKFRRRCGQNDPESELVGLRDNTDPSNRAIRRRSPLPESLWWDCSLSTSLPGEKATRNDVRLLKLYVDFIFPIQFGFYPMATSTQHSWLMSSLCGNEARYHGALCVSACFDASISEPQRVDGIGLSQEVMGRQVDASRALQTIISRFTEQKSSHQNIAKTCLQILEAMHQLLSLEVFSMLEGTWELHHQATMTLLDKLHTYYNPNICSQAEVLSSPLETALRDFSCPDTQKNFEFHLTCVVWIDVVANATYGTPLNTGRRFDYITYLHANEIKTQHIMGCHSSVMASIAEITCLADWRASQTQCGVLDADELFRRAATIGTRLREQVRDLEQPSVAIKRQLEAESRLVTLQFACAAEAYLHVVVFGPDPTHSELVPIVSRNLQMLDALPHGLVIRVNWAFTITGCLADESLHDGFRHLITRLAAKNQPLGMSWKGLIVMEECWRLRRSRPDLEATCDWKSATESLGKRILLV